MEDFFYDTSLNGRREYKHKNIMAALAAAGINITSTSLAASDSNTNVTICYKFQWRSYGNYIWSDSMETGGRDVDAVLYRIYESVKEYRKRLEDPEARGRYRYLEEE